MPKKIQSISLALFICVLLNALSVSAIEEKESSEDKEPDSYERSFIESNHAISAWVDGWADELDIYLAGEKLTSRENKSSLRIENTSIASQGSAKNWLNVNIDIRLPNVEEFWQLKFTAYDESGERAAEKVNPDRFENNQEDFGASLGFFKNFGKIRTTFRPRITGGSPVRVSHSLAFEIENYFGVVHFHPKFELFAKDSDGAGIFTSLNLDIKLTEVFSMTVIDDAEYFSKSHLFAVSNGLALGQILTDRHSLSYSFILDSNNKESYHLEAYTLSLGFHHTVYKNILTYHLTPFLHFARTANFAGKPGIILTLELRF